MEPATFKILPYLKFFKRKPSLSTYHDAFVPQDIDQVLSTFFHRLSQLQVLNTSVKINRNTVKVSEVNWLA